MSNKKKRMTKVESKQYAKKVDSYIKRMTPRVQEQLEHLIDGGLKLHESDYTPASVKGRIDSQPRTSDNETRDYFLDGKIFLSVNLPNVEFDKKGEHSLVSISFRMFDKKGNPVDDNDISTKGSEFDPLFDYSLVLDVIKRIGLGHGDCGEPLNPKEIIWCSDVNWYKLNGDILSMEDKDVSHYCGEGMTVESKVRLELMGLQDLDEAMERIFNGDLFTCFFEDIG